ncbi:MAG: hypothetical protein AAFQ57_08435 [Cyanobacteria bacterium J06626_14]
MTTQPMSTLLQTAFVEASSSDRNDSPQPYPIRLWQIGAPPETIPSETIVIVHGRQSGDFDENLPIDQLFLDSMGLPQSCRSLRPLRCSSLMPEKR